jgi:hypothetical protein
MNAPKEPRPTAALEQQLELWERNEVASFLKKQKESREQFYTGGGIPVKRVYTRLDVGASDEDIGLPGQYPFTRGPYPTMYRSRLWTMRQIAGFGTGEDTNQRFKYLIAQGQTGLSTDFDMPTLMGYDSDHPMSEGEVGREGVAIDTLADMEALFADIDLEKISVSMTINPTAWILLAMYIVLAQQRGNDLNKLSGTIQADILKEYIAQKEYIYPIAPSVRIVRDCITYCARNMKRYNPINISGYHISEGGRLSAARSRVHDGQCGDVRRRGVQDRHARRRVRAAAGVLLRVSGRLLRGDCEDARGTARLREDHARALRRAESGIDAPALSLSDRGRIAHQAAIPSQHHPHGDPGVGGRARRHAEPAHQWDGRGVLDPDRGSDAARAAHAAGDCR